MDLLEHAQQLVARGQNNSQVQAHTAYLQTLKQLGNLPEAEVKAAKPSRNNSKNSNFNAFYLVGGLMLFSAAILAIGYWWGKKKNKPILTKTINQTNALTNYQQGDDMFHNYSPAKTNLKTKSRRWIYAKPDLEKQCLICDSKFTVKYIPPKK